MRMVNSTTIPSRWLLVSDAESGKTFSSSYHKQTTHVPFSVGRYFADASLWIAIVHLLAMYKFMKPLDENGVEIDPDPKWSTGLVS